MQLWDYIKTLAYNHLQFYYNYSYKVAFDMLQVTFAVCCYSQLEMISSYQVQSAVFFSNNLLLYILIFLNSWLLDYKTFCPSLA